jgi:acetyl-CoA C-acetyltransferase
MLHQPLYIASYSQSKFGKLKTMTVPEIVSNAVNGACAEIDADPSLMDVGSIASACGFTLNDQGLLSGLMAMVPGLEGKPMESVENACASGGQAILSVAHKLLLGLGDVGIAVGYEKMRNNEGKMDGKLVGRALGVFSHPGEREGKVYIFPHLFAEVMKLYMGTHGVSEEDLARIAVAEYANATHNPDAQMRKVDITLEQAMTIEGINRYIVDTPRSFWRPRTGCRSSALPRANASSWLASRRRPIRCRRPGAMFCGRQAL